MTVQDNVAWSCVIDDTPEIRASILPWIASLTECIGADPARIFIHHVCPLGDALEAVTRELGINTVPVRRFDSHYPHANKIRQCATDFGDAGRVVLSDVDIAFAAPPPFESIRSPVAGKIVDQPNPPLAKLQDVFAAAGLPLPDTCSGTYYSAADTPVDFETLQGNFNGGLYALQRPILRNLGHAWTSYANWMIARPDLLGDYQKFLDQVSFCIAINSLKIPTGQLEPAWNFPLHLDLPDDGEEPCILHHHAELDAQQHLERRSLAWLDPAIDRVNTAIDRFRERHPPLS